MEALELRRTYAIIKPGVEICGWGQTLAEACAECAHLIKSQEDLNALKEYSVSTEDDELCWIYCSPTLYELLDSSYGHDNYMIFEGYPSCLLIDESEADWNNPIKHDEKVQIIENIFNYGSHFSKSLAKTWSYADSRNSLRIQKYFRDVIEKQREWNMLIQSGLKEG